MLTTVLFWKRNAWYTPCIRFVAQLGHSVPCLARKVKDNLPSRHAEMLLAKDHYSAFSLTRFDSLLCHWKHCNYSWMIWYNILLKFRGVISLLLLSNDFFSRCCSALNCGRWIRSKNPSTFPSANEQNSACSWLYASFTLNIFRNLSDHFGYCCFMFFVKKFAFNHCWGGNNAYRVETCNELVSNIIVIEGKPIYRLIYRTLK